MQHKYTKIIRIIELRLMLGGLIVSRTINIWFRRTSTVSREKNYMSGDMSGVKWSGEFGVWYLFFIIPHLELN